MLDRILALIVDYPMLSTGVVILAALALCAKWSLDTANTWYDIKKKRVEHEKFRLEIDKLRAEAASRKTSSLQLLPMNAQQIIVPTPNEAKAYIRRTGSVLILIVGIGIAWALLQATAIKRQRGELADVRNEARLAIASEQSARQDLESFRSRIARLSQDLQTAGDERAELAQHNLILQKQMEQTRQDLHDSQQRLSVAEQEMLDLRQERTDLRIAIDTLATERNAALSAAEIAKQQASSARLGAWSLRKDYEDLYISIAGSPSDVFVRYLAYMIASESADDRLAALDIAASRREALAERSVNHVPVPELPQEERVRVLPLLDALLAKETDVHVTMGIRYVIGEVAAERRPDTIAQFIVDLDDKNEHTRELAASYLGNFGAAAANAAPKLQQVAQNDPSAVVRQAANSALLSIEPPKEPSK